MNKFKIYEFFLYRKRFLFGYGLTLVGLIIALAFAGMYLPGGISNQEMQSVAKSSLTGFNSLTSGEVINLPYYLFQHICISLFSVTIFTIKLPSLILAFISAIGLTLILRIWFKPSVGVLASLVAITTGQFLFIAQDGTPNILYLFWPVCLLLLATLASYQQKFKWIYVLGFFIVSALSLYTPLSVYLLAAFVIVIFLHPHLRYMIKHIPRIPLISGIAIALIITIPLIIAFVKSPSISLSLFGIPTSAPNVSSNITALGAEYFGFSKPGGLTIMTPFFELGSMLLIAIGAFHVAKTRITAKNYVIAAWVLCLIPLMIFNPALTSITFLPLVLLLATGLNTLLLYWYRLFPNNPYARIGGLIPLTILVTVLIFSGTSRFIYGYEYDPSIVSNFTNDLELIPKDTKNLIVAESEFDFYNVVAIHNKKFTVSTKPVSDNFLATNKSHSIFNGYTISRVITSPAKNDNDRFYLYTKTAN